MEVVLIIKYQTVKYVFNQNKIRFYNRLPLGFSTRNSGSERAKSERNRVSPRFVTKWLEAYTSRKNVARRRSALEYRGVPIREVACRDQQWSE